MMPDGTLMNNTAMAGQHVMPNGEIMNNEDMEPMDPQPMDPFIEELCNAIEAGQILDEAELLRSIPGVTIVDRGARNSGTMNAARIRGLAVDGNALGDYAVSSVASVSTYVNDTPIFANFALRDLEPRIEIEEGLRLKAKQSLDRMLEMASGTIGKGDLGKV